MAFGDWKMPRVSDIVKPRLDICERQIEILTGSKDAEICIRLIHDKIRDHSAARKLQGNIQNLWPEIERAQEDGFGVFLVVNGGGQRDADINEIRAAFIDGDDIPMPSSWHVEPSFFVKRSATRWHAYWLAEQMDVAQFENLQKRLAHHYGSDPKVCNPSRVMRLAGTLHAKAEPVFVQLIVVDGLENWHARSVAALAQGLTERLSSTSKKVEVTHAVTEDQPQNIFRATDYLKSLPEVREGAGSDDAAYEAACVLKDFGISPGRCVSLMLDHFKCNVKDDWWVAAKVASAYQNGQNDPGAHAIAPAVETFASYAEKHSKDQPTEARPRSGFIKLDRREPVLTAEKFLHLHYRHPSDLTTLVCHNGDLLRWTGTHYAELENATLESQLYTFLHSAMDGEEPFRPNTHKVREVINAIKAQVHLAKDIRPPAWRDASKSQSLEAMLYGADELTACKNGLLHLSTRELAPHTPEFFTRNALPFDYNASAREPAQWLAFLQSIWANDPETIGTLQEIFGYLLSGDTRQQKAFLIIGPKRSGKSTIGRVLTQLLGEANVAGPNLANLSQNFGLEQLIGKRLALIPDARLSGRADAQLIAEKLLSITGEDTMTLDRKHRDAWTGKLPVRFVIISNEIPRIGDASGALSGRFILLKMHHSFFGREDTGLYNRLLPELSGILNWALDGWARLAERGYFKIPASSAEAIQELEDLSNPVGVFVRERCEVGPKYKVPTDDMHQEYQAWCHSGGRVPANREVFGRDFKTAFPEFPKRQPRVNGRQIWHYMGIRLRPQ